jgi:hypothetical protein
MDTFDVLTEDLGYLLARVELEGETCGLKHSKYDPAENHEAVDYLVQNLGDQKTGEVTQQIRIPVCQECIEALSDPNWILVYCTYCHKSQWICRRLAKNEYPDGNLIYWADVCPFCAEIADEYKED